jgi:pimeloyl-ACP methyl ester carboxylesterase
LPRFAADGLELAYETYGDGPPVVLLHGFTSSGASWLRLGWVEALVAAGRTAVALDLPGHGASGPVDDLRAATPRLAADVAALLDHLALERASLVGFSMGGGVALQLALAEPERVERLVVAGVGDPALDELHDPRVVAAVDAPAALAPYLRRGGWPAGLAAVQPLLVPALVVVAERDDVMSPADELIRRLRPAHVARFPELDHYEVVRDAGVLRAAVAFLVSP